MATNSLAGETSPYRRQHAENPVDWYPWGEEAFAAARRRDVPILLSIGYSACHWCHVMAHESFEDPATAKVVNDGFVSIKVDREERPDVDSIYMEAVQAVTGGGGWPMTVFLLPDGRPFHGGTYFPRGPFVELLSQVSEAWRRRREDLEQAAAALSDAVRSGTGLPGVRSAAGGDPDAARSPQLLTVALDSLLSRYDPEWGGFGRAPKFPQPAMLELLLRATARTGRADALEALTTTLDGMAAGGIYDHLGGGFARYSTDRRWLVPHFEKMLYDNALLARVYLHAWQLTGEERHRQVVVETLDYLLRPPVRDAGAGLASAEDADSEGVEGKFYVWDEAEVLDVAGRETADWYGVSVAGNWEGHNILFRPARASLARPPDVEQGRRRLLARRDTRVRPGLDSKVLTEWNAMAVAALAEAGASLRVAGWAVAAEEIGRFLLEALRRPGDGRWLRSWQAAGDGSGAQPAHAGPGPAGRYAGGGDQPNGVARHLAYAGDHAWLVEAFTRLAEATGRATWVAEARAAADALIDLFWDDSSRMFVTSGRDAEALIARPVDTQDGALPSANSVAAGALLRLAALTGVGRYRDHAEAVVASMAPAIGAAPMAFTGMVAAAELARTGLSEIAITGDRPDLLEVVRRRYVPAAVLAWGEPYESPLWDGRTGPEAAGLAFVCRDYACLAPVREPDELAAQLPALLT
ncbi:MAG: thioredoxin domain-containing protein [Acidimicrobiales bacterium]